MVHKQPIACDIHGSQTNWVTTNCLDFGNFLLLMNGYFSVSLLVIRFMLGITNLSLQNNLLKFQQ